MTFWPEKLPRWPLGARKTNLSFFVGVVFLKSGPHWQNIGLTYGIVTHPDAIKILRDALPEPRDVAFKTQKRHEHHERLTPCWNPENRNETPQFLLVKTCVGLKFSSIASLNLRLLSDTWNPSNLGGAGPCGLGPQAISVGNFVERLLRGSRAIDAEAKTHRGFPIHPSEKVTSWPWRVVVYIRDEKSIPSQIRS